MAKTTTKMKFFQRILLLNSSNVIFLILLLVVQNGKSFLVPESSTSSLMTRTLMIKPAATTVTELFSTTREKHQQHSVVETKTDWITEEFENKNNGENIKKHQKKERQQQDKDKKSATMKMILPGNSNNDDVAAIELLHRLDSLLRERGVKEHFDRLIKQGDSSVRKIQAGRYEVFVSQEDGIKDSNAFDWIATIVGAPTNNNNSDNNNNQQIEMNSDMVKNIILNYARRQAYNAIPNKDYHYHNFSLLINYDKCPQQYAHLDLLEPNSQYGLIVSNNAPGTVWFEPITSTIKSARDLKRVWSSSDNVVSSSSLEEISEDDDSDNDNWVDVMDSNDEVRSLLQCFGNVLSPNLIPHKPNHGAPLATGTLLALPGGVVHAGPACEGFRAVLFFSAHPTGVVKQNNNNGNGGDAIDDDDVVVPYNPDTQYFGSILLSIILSKHIWSNLCVRNRIFLLKRLVEYLHKPPANNRKMHKHLRIGSSMYEFVKTIETTTTTTTSAEEEATTTISNSNKSKCNDNNNTNLDKHIEQFANQEQLLL